ncbi:MAG: hypothetical protein LUQ54_04460 [Methanoregula sp.]|nr:hypothetical protein [Methanoregula sp.]
MTEVMLRYTWNTWAMFMDPGLQAGPPIREAVAPRFLPPLRNVSGTGCDMLHYTTSGEFIDGVQGKQHHSF